MSETITLSSEDKLLDINLATELWAIAQCPTKEIGIEGVENLMLPVIALYAQKIREAEYEKCKHIINIIARGWKLSGMHKSYEAADYIMDRIKDLK